MDASVWHGVFWNHLIYPELSYDEVEDPELTVAWVHEQLMHGAFPHYVVCICLDEYSYLSLAERRESVSLVKRVIQRHIPPQACQLLGFAHGNSVYFCGMLDDPDSATSRDAFIKCLERLRDEIAVVNAISATIGIAFLASSSIEAWRWAAQRAIVAQRSKVRLGASRVYVYDSAAHNACISHDSYWYLAQELYTLVRSGDIDQVDRVLGNTIKHFFLHVYAPLTHLVTILQCQIILMAQAAREVGVHPTEIDSDTERYLEQLGTTYDYAQLQKLIEDGARLFTTKVHDHFHCPSSRLVSATEEYIKAHLDDPAVSLQQIADALCTNPSYLSRSFKKAKGHGITEYINRQRVETAKRLLLDRKLQITDIAFQLGFGSLQHFGRVFRAIADCSPSDYRQSKNVQEE